MGRSLAELTAEIREINISHGWRPAEGGPGDTTWGDKLALLHSEISEAMEAYRDHRLADATEVCTSEGGEGGCDIHGHEPVKPEGVGSELADVLIRLLDMCDVFGLVLFDMDCELADVDPSRPRPPDWVKTFGDYITWLHNVAAFCITPVPEEVTTNELAMVLRALVVVAQRHSIDLTAETERKIAYNRTRPFRHGGRHL